MGITRPDHDAIAQTNLAAATNGEEYRAAMIDAYSVWKEPGLIDFSPRVLLSQPTAPTTETG